MLVDLLTSKKNRCTLGFNGLNWCFDFITLLEAMVPS